MYMPLLNVLYRILTGQPMFNLFTSCSFFSIFIRLSISFMAYGGYVFTCMFLEADCTRLY